MPTGRACPALTRERVHKAAAKVGYRMVRRGRAWPGSGGATAIGFVCDEISTDPWTAIGLDGVREKAWEHGLTLSVAVTRGDPDIEQAALAMIEAQPLAGLIYATINTRVVEPPPALFRMRTVLLNCYVADRSLPSVVPGEVAGGHVATEALLRAGHRRIGYINGEPGMDAARDRLKGYRQALATADLPFDRDLVRDGNWQPVAGYERTLELMRLGVPPTAIFCGNDLMAMGCYDALQGARPARPRRRRRRGLRRPRDRAAPASAADERASAASRDGHAGRRDAARDGRARMSPRPRQIKVECPLVERESI